MKSVMYHYVRKYDPSHPHFRFLDIKNFRNQLAFFESEFGFVEREEWLEFLHFGKAPKKKGKILLTFDDAMSCHYEYVFPELIERGLWGTFYVPTMPYVADTILDVHRIHLLCGRFDGVELLNLASSFISENMIPDAKKESFKKDTYARQKNYIGVTEFKRILNYFISYEFRAGIIDDIAQQLNYFFDAKNFYVDFDSLLEMKSNGMVIGSHTHSHPVMSKLDSAQQLSELEASFSLLKKFAEPGLLTYCHPYGGAQSFNTDTISILDKMNIDYSFMVDPRDITVADVTSRKHQLPRYDCNSFQFGKAS